MASTLRNVLVFLVLAAAAAATWLLGRPEPRDAAAREVADAAPLGYYLRDAVIFGTDAAGAVIYRIYAEHVEQRERGHDLIMTQVRVEYDPRAAVAWLLTAARATAQGDGERLHLYGAKLRSRPADEADSVVIETEELVLEPESYLAQSTGPVTVSRGGGRLQAAALTADLEHDVVELEEVHGVFDR